MKKRSKSVIGIVLIISGWFSAGIGFAEPLGGHPYNTMVFLSGFLLIIIGILTLVLPVKRSNR
jgi:putative Mn2+ efflux pump MntP